MTRRQTQKVRTLKRDRHLIPFALPLAKRQDPSQILMLPPAHTTIFIVSTHYPGSDAESFARSDACSDVDFHPPI